MRTIVLGSMLTGVGLAFIGAVLGVAKRRDDISLSQVLLAGSSLASHPERFVKAAWVRPLKILNLVGALAFLGGVLVIVAMSVSGQRFD
jgi:hypothetical protein